MGLPLVPMTVSWPADTKLFVHGTTATRKRHSGSLLLSTGRLEVPLGGNGRGAVSRKGGDLECPSLRDLPGVLGPGAVGVPPRAASLATIRWRLAREGEYRGQMRATIRPEGPADHESLRLVVAAAFTHHGSEVVGLVELLQGSGRSRVSLVADDGDVVGHVLLSIAWIDAPERLAHVLVLSPLAVAPGQQGKGIGTALVEASLVAARGLGAPAVFLEGDPSYYSRLNFVRASAHGFVPPSPRIPDAACQVVLLDAHEDWMRGPLVYNDAFWQTDSVGLRGTRLARAEESQQGLP